MTQNLRGPPKAGTYLTIYLSVPLYDHLEEEARKEGLGMPGWIRERLIELCPPAIQVEARKVLRNIPKGKTGNKDNSKPEPPPPPPRLTLEELVEKHREQVLELDAKGYLPTSIGGVLRIPYRAVSEILYRKAAPKKGPPK